MKTLKNQLSTLMLLIGIVFYNHLNAQKPEIENGMFVRVYNLKGKKIGKGKLYIISDSLLTLKRNSKIINLKPNEIGFIRTKQSTGHDVLVGSIIGVTTFAIIGAATSHEETKTANLGWLGSYEYTTGTSPGTGAAIGGGLGLVGGALTGLGVSALKNSKKFIINGDKSNWNAFEQLINE